MINLLNIQNKIIPQNIQPLQPKKMLNLSTNPLKPLGADTVSFSARKYDVKREAGYEPFDIIGNASRLVWNQTRLYAFRYRMCES